MSGTNLATLQQPALPGPRRDPFSSAAVAWLNPQYNLQENHMLKLAEESVARRNQDLLMVAACQIGRHLVDTAIWSDDAKHCTWLGRRDIQDREIAGYSDRNVAIGPELYSGTAGVALFLHSLYKMTGDGRFKKVAIASWKRSVHYLKTNPFPASAISFYAGDLGLLYVGHRLGYADSATRQRLAPDLAWLLGKLDKGLASQHSLDVIGGNAGAIAPLLFLANRYRLRRCRELAIECANEIVSLGTWQGDMCIWSAPKIHGVELDNPPLTGFSHGASGIGLALLEAYRDTGQSAYLTYANGAFAFEEELFNQDEGNWIDTRYPHFKRDGKICGTFRGAWCHGAPGIALAHLGAMRLNPSRERFHRERMTTAIATTRKMMQEKLQAAAQDATLCHGLFGLSDILLNYALQEAPELVSECQNQVLTYLQRFSSPTDLPSGLVCGGYSPSLLIGLSGIGLHLLRLANRGKVPSVLLLNRDTLA